MGTGTPVRPLLMEHLTKHENVQLYVKDLVTETDFTEQQIRNCIGSIIREDVAGAKTNLEVVVAGHQWCWKPKSRQSISKTLYEELAITKSGDILVQDENGNVYKLLEI